MAECFLFAYKKSVQDFFPVVKPEKGYALGTNFIETEFTQ